VMRSSSPALPRMVCSLAPGLVLADTFAYASLASLSAAGAEGTARMGSRVVVEIFDTGKAGGVWFVYERIGGLAALAEAPPPHFLPLKSPAPPFAAWTWLCATFRGLDLALVGLFAALDGEAELDFSFAEERELAAPIPRAKPSTGSGVRDDRKYP